MLKWKKALTAYEAAFWVLKDIFLAPENEWMKDFMELGDDWIESAIQYHEFFAKLTDASYKDRTNPNRDYNQMLVKMENYYYEVETISMMLEEEIELGWDTSSGSFLGILDIENHPRGYGDPIITKPSLANWFYQMGDIEKAKICYPAFVPQNDFPNESVRSKDSLKLTDSPIGSKSRNSYLRTIHALSHALLKNGLSGKDSADAQLILKKLALKKIDAPLGEKALGAYLKAARELS